MTRTRLPVACLVWLGLLLGAGPLGADVGSDVLTALRQGLRSDAPELRRKAVLDAGRMKGHLDEKQLRRAALAIRKAFPEEADRETRRLMVRALARMRIAAAWVPVILASFEDRDPDVQAAARQEVLGGGADFLVVVQKLIAEDQDPTFRANLLLVLRDRRKPDAIPMLLAGLGEKSPRVQSAAAEALEAITGQAFGYDAKLWGRWYALWKKSSQAEVDPGKSVAPGEGVVEEPPPHVTRALVPDFYGVPLHAKDLVFVVDISGSVGPDGVGRAKRELIDAVERLGSDVHIAALFFSDEVKLWKTEFVRATPANKAALAYFLRGVVPGRRTDVFTPFNAGLQLVRKRVEQKDAAGEAFRTPVTMIAVSDGRDNMAKTPAHIVEEKLDRLDLERTVVHAIVLGPEDSQLMHQLAQRGGGRYARAR